MANHIDALIALGIKVPVAARLLQQLGGLQGVLAASEAELASCGVPKRSISKFAAALQLARLTASRASEPKATMMDDAAAAARLRPMIGHLQQEVFVVMALDIRNGMIDIVEVSRGTVHGVEVHPREVFRAAMRLNAAAIVVAHNHPSGDATPSPEDIAVTKRLREVGALVGIPVIDHLVITQTSHCSIAISQGAEF